MGVVKSATTPQVASTTPARSRRPPAHDVLAPRPSMDAARAPDAPGAAAGEGGWCVELLREDDGSVEGADLDDVLASRPSMDEGTPRVLDGSSPNDVLASRPSMDEGQPGSVEGADLDDVLGIRASDLDYVLGIRASINADDDSVKGEAVAAADKDLENDVLRPGASIIENAACVEGEAVAAADGDLTRCAYECLYDLTRCAYECLYSD